MAESINNAKLWRELKKHVKTMPLDKMNNLHDFFKNVFSVSDSKNQQTMFNSLINELTKEKRYTDLNVVQQIKTIDAYLKKTLDSLSSLFPEINFQEFISSHICQHFRKNLVAEFKSLVEKFPDKPAHQTLLSRLHAYASHLKPSDMNEKNFWKLFDLVQAIQNNKSTSEISEVFNQLLDKRTLFDHKLEDITTLWENKLPARLQSILSYPGLLEAIKARGNLNYQGQKVEDSFQSQLPPVLLLSKMLAFDGFSIKDPGRQFSSSLNVSENMVFLDGKIKHFLESTPLIKSDALREKILSEVFKFHNSLKKKLKKKQVLGQSEYFTQEQVIPIVKGFLKQFGLTNHQLILNLAQACSQNSCDMLCEAVRFELSSAKANNNQNSVDVFNKIISSDEPFKIWIDTDASLLENSLISIVEAQLKDDNVRVDSKRFIKSFENKVITLVLDNLPSIQKLMDATKNVSFGAQVLPLLSNQVKVITPQANFSIENGLVDSKTLVVGENLRNLDLLKFLEAYFAGQDLRSYFAILSQDMMQTSFYMSASIKVQQKIIKTYLSNAFEKLAYLYTDKDKQVEIKRKLIDQYDSYIREDAVSQLKSMVGVLNQKIQKKSQVGEIHKLFFEKFSKFIDKLDVSYISPEKYQKLEALIETVKNTYELDEDDLSALLQKNPEYLNFMIENIASEFESYLTDQTLTSRMQALINLADASPLNDLKKNYHWLDKELDCLSFAKKYTDVVLDKNINAYLRLKLLMHYDSFQIGTQRLFVEVRAVEKYYLNEIVNRLDKIKKPIVEKLKSDLQAYYQNPNPSFKDYQSCVESFEATLKVAQAKKSFFSPLKALLFSCLGLFKDNVEPLHDILQQQKSLFEAIHSQFNQTKS